MDNVFTPVPREAWDKHVDETGARDAQSFIDTLKQTDQAEADATGWIASLHQQAAADAAPPAPPPRQQAPSSVVSDPTDLRGYARGAAGRAGIDPAIFERQIQQESNFDPVARSGAGAQGIAQIVPEYHPGVDTSDPHASLDYAANLMKTHLDRYGGDYRKALAAYNAGPGAVDKAGGVPDFEETQRYVRTIYDDPQAMPAPSAPAMPEPAPVADIAQQTPAPASFTPTEGDRPPSEFEPRGDLRPSQFGDPALSTEEAYSACGPAAAVAFARANGRNPSLREALDVAKDHGWTAEGGMSGIANEAATLDALGVPYKLDTKVTWGKIQQDAMSGNPVIVSTPGHYFVVSSYDPATKRYQVGTSGTDVRGGSDWMTPGQIQERMGAVNGALFVDSPGSPIASIASKSADPETAALSWIDSLKVAGGQAVDAGKSVVGAVTGAVGQWADRVQNPAPAVARGLEGFDAQTRRPGMLDALGTELDAAADVATPYVKSAAEEHANMGGTPEERATRIARMRAGGPVFATNEEAGAAVERMTPIALSMSGEPIKVVGSAVRAARGMATAEGALGQPGMSLDVQGAPVPKIRTAAQTEAEVGRLRLDKFPEEVRDTIQQAATEGDFWKTQRRGVIPDAQAEKMADDLGRSVDQMIAGGKVGRSYNTEETRALRNALTSQGVKVADLNAAIAEAPHKAPPELIAESIAEGMKMADLSRVAEGARAEAGRTFRAYRDFTRDSVTNPGGAVERIFKAVGGAEQATKAVQEYQKLVADGADVFKLASFWAQKEAPPVNFLDWWELVRRNSMLSGPRTLEINALSGVTEIPWKIGTDFIQSAVRGHPGEIVPEVRALWAGLRRGSTAAVQTLAHGITEEQALAGDVPRSISERVSNPLAKGAALALEAPMRAQQATDDVVRSIGFSMHVAREAAVTATKEGLKGQAWTERVADLMDTPTPVMLKRADLAADDMTFKGDMGKLGSLLTHVQKYPIAGPMIIPFLKTVYHITSRGIDRSPLGFVGTGIDVARGVYKDGKKLPKGVRELGPRLTDNVLGSAASVWFYDQAMRGNITGAGPDDPEKRKMLEAQGWQPYAVKLGGDYVSYTNWGPVAMPLALMAGVAEARTFAKPGKDDVGSVAADALQRSVKVLTEQNYLQGVGAIYKSMTDFERYGHQWLTGYLSSLVPYGAAINTVGQATDPLVRQPAKNDVGQALAARVPGLREGVPAKQDVLGRDVRNEQQGLAAANPLRTREGRPDATLKVLLDNGADIGQPPKEIKAVPLTTQDQQRHQEIAGGLIQSTVQEITGDDRFAALEPEVRKKILQRAIERSRAAASGILFDEIGIEELKRRMVAKQAVGASR